MNLDLTETQSLLRETVRSYLEGQVPFDRIRELEKAGRYDETLWKEVALQGWIGLPFTEASGGGDGSLVDVGLLVEEFARRAAIVPVLEVFACGRILERLGTDAGDLVASILAGEAMPVPAIWEGSECGGEVTARVSRGAVSGTKRFVDYGQFASHHVVAADDGLYLVDARGAGVETTALRSIGRTPLCDVRYEGAPARKVAPAEAVPALIRLGRALAAVQIVGSMQTALDQTVGYVKVREQFGVAIGTFQAVRHHAANMATRANSARILAYEALDALDRGVGTDSQAALAKASASRAAPEVTMLAHQLHGGNGVIEENDLYFFTLRAKEQSLAWGSYDECMAVVADQVHEEQDWF